jgi:HSP20 family protein
MLNMIVPRFDIAFRPSRSLFDEWIDPYFVECEDWVQPADNAETGQAYRVTMELPGIDMKKLDIAHGDGILIVKGEKQKETVEGECCYCAERYSGSFQRRIGIPGKVDSDKIDATYKDGVLTLTLPKAQESIPRKIEVH